MVTIFTAAMYEKLFGVNAKTASTWLAQDKKALGVPRITYGHVKERYALRDEDFDCLKLSIYKAKLPNNRA